MMINYRHKERLTTSDLEQIVCFHRMVKSYIKMKQMLEESIA